MSKVTNAALRVFNKPDVVTEGWYWALRSADLKRGQVKPATVCGRELAIFRDDQGGVHALDAQCPHRGASLGMGKVEGQALRCPYHRWKYDAQGQCVDIPMNDKALDVSVRSWPVRDHYGLIWVWTGETPTREVIEVPELEGQEVDTAYGGSYDLRCHPNVVMCDAIDVHHFATVHNIDYLLDMDYEHVGDNGMRFTNKRKPSPEHWIGRALKLFYKDAVTYALNYEGGISGTVTLGPDFHHFHILFANRPGPDGRTEGQIILITKKRRALGWLYNRVMLFVGGLVVGYFGIGDEPNFQTIRFDFKSPIKADKPLISFIEHVERQPTVKWGFGTTGRSVEEGCESASPALAATATEAVEV